MGPSIHRAEGTMMRVQSMVAEIGQDVRFALRQLRRARAFTAVSLVTLTLGIGATTAIFTVLNTVVLQPLPFPNAGRLIDVATQWQGGAERRHVQSHRRRRARARSRRERDRELLHGSRTAAGPGARVPERRRC